MPHNADTGSRGHQFGTFAGVFTPSILTILGVIMFLRAGFVVGQAGIRDALLILLIAECISVLTATSMAGISTNTPVKGGGAYYLISRVLGPGFGGSIGLALFMAQALSVPFYILGFTESLVQTFPLLREYFVWIAMLTAVVLFVINYIGAGWAIKIQYLVMTLLGLSIIAFMGGAVWMFRTETFAANWVPEYTGHYNFWVLFAIYFPAVTGIMAGVNMSGDLKDPARSLARGTFAAIIVGGLIYLLEMLLCGGAFSRAALVDRPYELLVRNALFGAGFLVVGGVFAATLSSAVGSFMGAPRVLQALSRDKMIGVLSPFAKGGGANDEPRRALILTWCLTLLVLAAASGKAGMNAFDFVASVVTMFFLSTYGMVNLAAFVESFSSNPSFRPRFRFFHWSTALLGALACLAVMFLIDARAAVMALVVVVLLYVYISRRAYKVGFGDARRGFVFSLVTRNLWRLRAFSVHPKNWRPTFLVLSGNPETRLTLLHFAVWMEARRGIVSMAELMQGNLEEMTDTRNEARERAERFVHEHGLSVYPEVVVTRDFDEGIRVMLQTHSIGPIKPNTIVMGWPREAARVRPFVQHLRDIRRLGLSALCVIDKGVQLQFPRRVDIWWRGRENGSLMLILSHLLTQNWEWSRTHIRILRVVADEAGREPAHRALTALAEAARIDAEVVVIVSKDPVKEVMPNYSRNASVVFMGFSIPDEGAANFYAFCTEVTESLPTTILVNSNGQADLQA